MGRPDGRRSRRRPYPARTSPAHALAGLSIVWVRAAAVSLVEGSMIAAIYARKSTEQNGVADEQKSVARQIEHARQYADAQGLDGRRGARLRRRRDLRRRVREPARLPAADERAEAAAAVPGARDVRGIAARTRGDRDGVRAQAARDGRRARVLLPRGPRADARLPDRQDHAVADGVRRRARAREGAAADVRRDAAEGARPATSPAGGCSATTTSRCSGPDGKRVARRTRRSTRPRRRSCGGSSSCRAEGAG